MMVRRREKDIKKGCFAYLQTLENQGVIAWYDRLNSGKYFIPGSNGYRGRLVQGCRNGTSDAYAILNDGRMIWIEFKTTKGKLTEDQTKFADMVSSLEHLYIVVRQVSELEELMERLIWT